MSLIAVAHFERHAGLTSRLGVTGEKRDRHLFDSEEVFYGFVLFVRIFLKAYALEARLRPLWNATTEPRRELWRQMSAGVPPSAGWGSSRGSYPGTRDDVVPG